VISQVEVMSTDYFGPTVRFCRLLVFPFEKEFGDIVDRIKRHSKIVDSTAMAIEMLRTAEFRKGEVMNLVSIRTLANELLRGLIEGPAKLENPMPHLAEAAKYQSYSPLSGSG
jgi:hypothetical protein